MALTPKESYRPVGTNRLSTTTTATDTATGKAVNPRVLRLANGFTAGSRLKDLPRLRRNQRVRAVRQTGRRVSRSPQLAAAPRVIVPATGGLLHGSLVN